LLWESAKDRQASARRIVANEPITNNATKGSALVNADAEMFLNGSNDPSLIIPSGAEGPIPTAENRAQIGVVEPSFRTGAQVREPNLYLRKRVVVEMGSINEQEIDLFWQATSSRPVGPVASEFYIVGNNKAPPIRTHHVRAIVSVDTH
jgi:hypothetical protein